jgi:hypothetical protein
MHPAVALPAVAAGQSLLSHFKNTATSRQNRQETATNVLKRQRFRGENPTAQHVFIWVWKQEARAAQICF